MNGECGGRKSECAMNAEVGMRNAEMELQSFRILDTICHNH